MAVYTDIAETELIDYLSHYQIGELLSYKGIAEGVENSNFLLHTTEGAFILTLYEKRVNRDDLPFFLELLEHLHAGNIACPVPVKQKNGELTGTLAGRPAAIVTFLEGMWKRNPSVANCFEVGKNLAQMHVAGRDFNRQRNNDLAMPAWRPLFAACQDQADAVKSGLKDEIERALKRLEHQWPQDLPHGVIHADLFPDNVFFLGEQVSGLIDFYFACWDFLAYDLAICMNAWCFEKDFSFNVTKATALLKGYQSIRPLQEDEISALPLLAAGAAMRFLLTRLYDWINTPEGSLVVKKDPLDYLVRLRFFSQVHNVREIGI